MDRLFAGLAALGGFLAVTAGTLAAHFVKGQYPEDQVAAFYVGVQYQYYHCFALFAVAWACGRKPSIIKEGAGWLMILGTVLFSGSLYAYGLTRGTVFGYVAAGGGVLLMLGWLMLALGVLDIRLRPETAPTA